MDPSSCWEGCGSRALAAPLPAILPLSDRPGLARERSIDQAVAEPMELDDREMDVLRELARGGDEGRTAFQGLRRRLGLHQQALTRTLRRLERQGVVHHDAQGYALTGQGQVAMRGRAPLMKRGEALPVLQALLPPTVTAEDVADRLARRWFRDLRWYGRADTPAGTALTWLTLDRGLIVRVRFASGMAVLEVEVPPGERLEAFPAAQAVLRALSDLYGPGEPTAA